MLIFHSLSYIAVLHTECLKSTATRLRFNEVMHCAAFPLKLLFYHISELFWCHINLSRASQMCRTGSTVGRCCRLGLFGNGERGSVLQGATGSVAGQPPLAVQPPRSARTGLQLENDSRTSNIRNLPLCAPASEIRTQHYVGTFWSSLGLPCDLVSSPGEGERCDQARMDKPACDQTILQHPRCWGCSEKPGQ